CYDEETEILTPNGWVPFPELQDENEVAQWESGVISFVKPSAVYRGKLARREMVHVKSDKCLDFKVTAEHKCLILDYKDRETLLPAKELQEYNTDRHCWIPNCGMQEGPGVAEHDDMLRLIVALQADSADRGGSWRFFLKRERKIERL